MIYCLCNNINTAKVDAAAAQGAECASCVMKSCNTKFNCGQCREDINARLTRLRSEHHLLEAAG